MALTSQQFNAMKGMNREQRKAWIALCNELSVVRCAPDAQSPAGWAIETSGPLQGTFAESPLRLLELVAR